MDICKKEQDDDSVGNLLKFVRQRPEQNKTMRPKNYQHHYPPPQKNITKGK